MPMPPQGQPVTIRNAVCLHEEDAGMLWKHTDTRLGRVEVRRNRRLVVSQVSTFANYEYAMYWNLYLVSGFIFVYVCSNGGVGAVCWVGGCVGWWVGCCGCQRRVRHALAVPVEHIAHSRLAHAAWCAPLRVSGVCCAQRTELACRCRSEGRPSPLRSPALPHRTAPSAWR